MPAARSNQFEQIIKGVDEFCSLRENRPHEWWTSHENLRDHALFKCYSYAQVISGGMDACVQNLFSSPYAEKCEAKTANTHRM